MYGNFLVEGDKLVRELLQSELKVLSVYKLTGTSYEIPDNHTAVFEVTESELQKISTHENPNQVLAIAKIPDTALDLTQFESTKGVVLLCDHIADPGNAGSIIRTAEWFGVSSVIFSENSVDLYNPKVVSAAKGSLFRIPCFTYDLQTLLKKNVRKQVYGTFMQGSSIYTVSPSDDAMVIIGNEANGITNDLLPFIAHRLSVPAFGKAESLNAAVATGIVLSEFARKHST